MNCWLPMVVFALLVGLSSIAHAVQTGDPGVGAAYAKQVCAKCHAIGRVDTSPEPTATPFRDVANTPGMTATALKVWLTTGHPTMPHIVLDPQELDNIIAFIISLKE